MRFFRDDFTEAQQKAFLEMLGQGIALDVAARAEAVGTTATAIKAYRLREPAFDQAVVDAMEEGRHSYADRLRATARARATAIDGGSDRLLEVELATHVPGYEHLRRDRLRVNGTVQHEHAIVLDPAAIAALPTEKLEVLRELLAEMAEATVDGEYRELGPGE